MNEPARTLFGIINVQEGDSLLDLMLGDVLPAMIDNWSEVAYHSAQRLRTESVAQGGVSELDRAANLLALVPQPDELPMQPVVPTRFRIGDRRLSLFTTLAQFGTPEDLTLDDLKIEFYFPADGETAEALKAMSGV